MTGKDQKTSDQPAAIEDADLDAAHGGISTAAFGAPSTSTSSLPDLSGADFSGIEPATGDGAKGAGSLGAEGFAMGDALTFKSSTPDKTLVGHELTHTIQQGGKAKP